VDKEYNSFIPFNIPEEEEWFKEFITNTLQHIEGIVKIIKVTFLNCVYVIAKMQSRFGIIWKGLTVEDGCITIVETRTHQF
jgi:hypothetical protein